MPQTNSPDILDRVRKIVLSLPEVTERLSHGAPCFYVNTRRPLCYYHDEHYDHRTRPSLMCPAFDGVPQELVSSDLNRFYQPTPSANGTFNDWLGIYLDTNDPQDWNEITAIIHDAYRKIAPRRLAANPPDTTPQTEKPNP